MEHKDETDIITVLKKCFQEYCDAVGDSPCGCDVCKYCGIENDGCFEAYKEDKLHIFTE